MGAGNGIRYRYKVVVVRSSFFACVVPYAPAVNPVVSPSLYSCSMLCKMR
jgi:hypothetical protein